MMDLLFVFASFAILLIVNHFLVIETELFRILCMMLFVTFFIQGMIAVQSRRTNRRIDLLMKIIQKDQNINN